VHFFAPAFALPEATHLLPDLRPGALREIVAVTAPGSESENSSVLPKGAALPEDALALPSRRP
jgi:hypothetical protein